ASSATISRCTTSSATLASGTVYVRRRRSGRTENRPASRSIVTVAICGLAYSSRPTTRRWTRRPTSVLLPVEVEAWAVLELQRAELAVAPTARDDVRRHEPDQIEVALEFLGGPHLAVPLLGVGTILCLGHLVVQLR